MDATLNPLIRNFVAWVAREPRPNAEALEARRTSCPRLTVWEDAIDRGLVERQADRTIGAVMVATPVGLDFIAESATRVPN